MGCVREALSDSDGLVDIAYVMVAAVGLTAVAVAVFLCTMSVIDYHNCAPTLTISTGADTDSRHVVPCRYDPTPLGTAIGYVFTAFAALLGALAGYMAATRRQPKPTTPIL